MSGNKDIIKKVVKVFSDKLTVSNVEYDNFANENIVF